ncbi:unnamed protein product [Rangifer tarandus platyrhynchus]|uniref:Uncharacterized protein n=1 Tax=Rangifer tarandus platyrhynchus TaxID=3082113 RepID=A0AC59YFB7_RANTA
MLRALSAQLSRPLSWSPSGELPACQREELSAEQGRVPSLRPAHWKDGAVGEWLQQEPEAPDKMQFTLRIEDFHRTDASERTQPSFLSSCVRTELEFVWRACQQPASQSPQAGAPRPAEVSPVTAAHEQQSRAPGLLGEAECPGHSVSPRRRALHSPGNHAGLVGPRRGHGPVSLRQAEFDTRRHPAGM